MAIAQRDDAALAERLASWAQEVDRTRGPQGGGLGLASFLLGDVSVFQRTASGSTDARDRQWRHFYYVQDTWRATPQLTPEPRFVAVNAAVPRPRSRGPPSLG